MLLEIQNKIVFVYVCLLLINRFIDFKSVLLHPLFADSLIHYLKDDTSLNCSTLLKSPHLH